MIIIKDLRGVTPELLAEVFNRSFAGYFVPLQMSAAQIREQIDYGSIDLRLSVGAFDQDRLVGFILHSFGLMDGRRTLYNAGTGVIPEFRGQGLTRRMYTYILPLAVQEQISRMQLEVITTNQVALNAYESVGFTKNRLLNCYKGRPDPHFLATPYVIKEINNYSTEQLQSFWDWQPSWQHSFSVPEQARQKDVVYGIFEGTALAGYLLFNPLNHRIRQLAINKAQRNKGLARRLLSYLAIHYPDPIAVINVDASAQAAHQLLRSTGLEPTLSQYEMIRIS